MQASDILDLHEDSVQHVSRENVPKSNGTIQLRNPSLSREGYGFRPRSGLSTPQVSLDEEGREVTSPIPDQYGLGWPGEFSST
jgi:hypothetical protein